MEEAPTIQAVRIPKLWRTSQAVERLEGTRWYVEKSSVNHFRHWLRELHEHLRAESGGILIPLQWVPEYVGVSRAAVHQRANRGGLTVFSYVITGPTRTILGRVKGRESRKQYDLVPFSECEQWRELLMWVRNQGVESELGENE